MCCFFPEIAIKGPLTFTAGLAERAQRAPCYAKLHLLKIKEMWKKKKKKWEMKEMKVKARGVRERWFPYSSLGDVKGEVMMTCWTPLHPSFAQISSPHISIATLLSTRVPVRAAPPHSHTQTYTHSHTHTYIHTYIHKIGRASCRERV